MSKKFFKLFFFLFLMSGTFLGLNQAKAVEYSNTTPRSDWYKRTDLVPQFYEDCSNQFKLVGNSKVDSNRKDALLLSSDEYAKGEEVGQAFLKNSLSLNKNFSFTLYATLDYDNSPDTLQFFFSGEKQLVEASKNGFEDIQNVQLIKSALSLRYGKDQKEYSTVGNYFDCEYKDENGVNYSFDLVDGKVEVSSPYTAPQNGLGSNSVYFQNGYKLYVPDEIKGYSKESIYMNDDSKDIFMLFHQPELSLKSIYNEIV